MRLIVVMDDGSVHEGIETPSGESECENCSLRNYCTVGGLDKGFSCDTYGQATDGIVDLTWRRIG